MATEKPDVEAHETTDDNTSLSDASSDVTDHHHHDQKREIKANFTDAETKGLEHLRKLVNEQLGDNHSVTDFVLLRFLRARKFDVPAAADQYVKQVHWRIANKIDQWNANPPVYFRKLVPEAFHGFDKKGYPLYIVKAGQLNPVHLQRMSVQDFINVHIWGMEYSFQRCHESSVRLGRNIDRFTNIIDFEGLGMKHRKCLDYVKAVVHIDERYYPETLEHTFVINAPWAFTAFWKIVKGWLDPVTAAKVSVLGSNYAEELLKYIDADVLPKEYGGKCDFSVRVYTDQEIDEALAASDAKIDFKEVAVKAKAKHEIQFRIGKHGGFVHYHFTTKANDIKFGITFKPDTNPNDIVVLLKPNKINSHKSPEKGQVEINEPGVATVTWDNGYSLWTDKVLRYHCTAEDVTEEQAVALAHAKHAEADDGAVHAS